jgi:hypothetical protein
MMLPLLLLLPLACADPAEALRLEAIELRIKTLEERAEQTTLAITSLQANVPEIPDSEPDTPRVEVGTDAALLPILDKAGVEACVFDALMNVRTAQSASDAAFDKYQDDFLEMGFVMESAKGCGQHVALRVAELTDFDYRVEALVLLGSERGRLFSIEAKGTANERKRLTEAQQAEWLAKGKLAPVR